MKRTLSRFFFERFSGYYDWLLSAGFQITLRREFLSFINPDKNHTLIEFGSGPGNFLSLAAPRYKSVTGLDSSRSMTARAVKRLKRESITNVICANSELDDFVPESQYDAGAGVSFLYLLENRERSLEKMVSAIKPGGTFAIMEPSEDFSATTAKRCGQNSDFGIRDRFSLHNWLRSVQLHGGLSEEYLRTRFRDSSLRDIVIKPALSGLVLFARATRND